MLRLDEALRRRADRGTPVGAETMIERVAMELQGHKARQVAVHRAEGETMTTRTPPRTQPSQPLLQKRRRWRAGLAFGAALLVVLGVIGIIALLPEDGDDVVVTEPPVTPTAAPEAYSGLVWSQAIDVPSSEFYAVTAAPDGFLAASPGLAGGVDFWTSADGHSWQLLASDQTAFDQGELVWRLSRGPSGFVADVGSWDEPSVATVWTSSDGVVWHRSELQADLETSESPYATYAFGIERTVAGPGGFVTMGLSSLSLDYEAIVAEFAPEASGGEYFWGETPSGLEIHTDTGVVPVPYGDLGINADQLAQMGPAGMSVLMWQSADGISWQTVDSIAIEFDPESEGWWPELVATDEAFYLFAGAQLGYRSADGQSWDSFDMVGLPAGLGFGVAAVEDGFLLFGATEEGRSIWTSPDGVEWSQLEIPIPDDLSRAMDFDVEWVSSGPLGTLVSGVTMVSAEYYVPGAVVISKDGYVFTHGGSEPTTLVNEATGETLARFNLDELEMGPQEGPVVVTREGDGFVFTDSATGEEFLVITAAEIEATEEATERAAGIERESRNLLAFSSDLATWTVDEITELFGNDGSLAGVTVGVQRIVALVAAEGEADTPLIQVWVAEPTT